MEFKRKESAGLVQTKVYKFRIFPKNQEADFPEEIKAAIFREARLMNDFRNRLVEIRKAVLASLDEIYTQEVKKLPARGEGEKKLSSKELKKLSNDYRLRSDALWKDFEAQIRALDADPEVRELVPWEVREDVIRRFETSHKTALKIGGELKTHSNFIERFHFPHRFTGGGLDARAIHSNRSKKLFIESVAADLFETETYSSRKNRVVSGRFGTGIKDRLQIPFRIVLHRQIPEVAKIKTAILTGKYKNRAWRYFLVLTVDEPLAETSKDVDLKVKAVAGLDLGWRKFDEYIRFGMLVDSDGNKFELRLPHNVGKKQSHRRLERLLAKHGQQMREKPQTWQDIEDWQTKNDTSIERAKELLREMDLPQNETTESILNRLGKIRKSGLLRLLRTLEEIYENDRVGNAFTDVPRAIEMLTLWRIEFFEREDSINYARDRLINNRNYNYQLLANWLKDTYSAIAYGGDLPLQRMAEQAAHISLLEENGPNLKNSAKFRGRVSLYELLRWIKLKQRKGENWLQLKKSDYSTITCGVCGANCKKTSNLFIICENGHEQDQDVQAATNLRNELADHHSASVNLITIPEKLKTIVVRIEN